MKHYPRFLPRSLWSSSIVALAIIFISLSFSATTHAQLTATEVNQETLTVVEEFSAESHTLLYPDQTYTPVSTFQGVTYLVWVNPDRYPMVTRIEDGVVQTERLDDNDAYKPLDDGHHKFSIGIDEHGYIHVVGDMHHYPRNNKSHLVSEYLGGDCMYWVSDSPGDISSFTWEGDSSQAPKGYGHSYAYFVNDYNGTLYYAARNRADASGFNAGDIGYSVQVYDTATKTWEAKGSPAPGKDSDKLLVAWEDNGAGNIAYQSMRSDVRFDRDNRMHFVTTINNDNSNSGFIHKSSTDVLYAYSDDGGNSFYRADGTSISSLPMRAESGSDQGDVIDSQQWFSMPASVAFNQFNEPFVHFVSFDGVEGSDTARYSKWDRINGWSSPADLPLNAAGWDRQYSDGRGVITLSSKDAGEFYRTVALDEPGTLHQTPFLCMDRRYMHDTGELRGISFTTDSNTGIITLKVVRLETSLPKAVDLNVSDSYSARPLLQEVTNGVGSGGFASASTGTIATGTSGTYGLNAKSSIDLSGADQFTIEWVVNNVSIGSVGDILANGWFFGVTANTNATGTGSTSLWNQTPDAMGVLLFSPTHGDMSFVQSEGYDEVTQALGAAAPDIDSLEDGFVITMTVRDDDTWTATSVGLSTDFSSSGTLDSLIDFSDLAGDLVAFTSIQGSGISYTVERVTLMETAPSGLVPSFIPDENTNYYLEAVNGMRLSSGGNSYGAADAVVNSTTGPNVEWKFSKHPTTGLYHIDRADGGIYSRLRTNHSSVANMGSPSWDGAKTQFLIEESTTTPGSYYLTAIDADTENVRLQLNLNGTVGMATDDSTGSDTSIKIIEQ